MGVREDVKKFNIARVLTLIFALFPLMAGAAVSQPANFAGLVMIAVNALTNLLPVIVLLALIYFLWGLARYLKNAGENKDEAKTIMLHGIIAFFVMSSVWGLVGILTTTFETGEHRPSQISDIDQWTINELHIQEQSLLERLQQSGSGLESAQVDVSPIDYDGQVSWPAEESSGSKGWLIPGSFPDEAATDMQAAPSDTGFKSWLPWNWGD